jgi:hypothetical protein
MYSVLLLLLRKGEEENGKIFAITLPLVFVCAKINFGTIVHVW